MNIVQNKAWWKTLLDRVGYKNIEMNGLNIQLSFKIELLGRIYLNKQWDK